MNLNYKNNMLAAKYESNDHSSNASNLRVLWVCEGWFKNEEVSLDLVNLLNNMFDS